MVFYYETCCRHQRRTCGKRSLSLEQYNFCASGCFREWILGYFENLVLSDLEYVLAIIGGAIQTGIMKLLNGISVCHPDNSTLRFDFGETEVWLGAVKLFFYICKYDTKGEFLWKI